VALVRPVGAPPPEPTAGAVVLRDPANGLSWGFEACRPLGSEHEVIEHKVIGGGGQELIVKLPGRLRFLDLECVRPVSADLSLWEWRRQVERGDIEAARRDLALDLYDTSGRGLETWTVSAAWPSRLEAVLLPGDPSERVRIVMEGVTRAAAPPPTPTPAPTATPTRTPTVTPTPVIPAPTPTPIPPGNVIFGDGFESSDTSAWSGRLGPG